MPGGIGNRTQSKLELIWCRNERLKLSFKERVDLINLVASGKQW